MSENIAPETYLTSITQFVKPDDIVKGLIKAPVFGVIISIVACQQGMRTTNGAVGVGRATTNAVVISMVLVYVSNFLIAQITN
jgi:phospholipid/cholesterol/gamma-HCH transport system permease protein